jgi:hypothetical protein
MATFIKQLLTSKKLCLEREVNTKTNSYYKFCDKHQQYSQIYGKTIQNQVNFTWKYDGNRLGKVERSQVKAGEDAWPWSLKNKKAIRDIGNITLLEDQEYKRFINVK